MPRPHGGGRDGSTAGGCRRDPDQVVIAPGSKALLWALLSVLPGDVVLPRAVVGQLRRAGRARGQARVERADRRRRLRRRPRPGGARGDACDAARQGARPGVLVLTLPDNPTGTVPSAGEVAARSRSPTRTA